MAGQAHLVYHGTILDYARDIVNNGINLARQRADTDFGQGFYVTTQWTQAQVWAQGVQDLHKGATLPAIVVFYIEPNDWNPLSGLIIKAWPSADARGERLVSQCRQITGSPSKSTPTLPHKYQYIYGPVYKAPWSSPRPLPGKDQLSVHDLTAAQVLHQGCMGIWRKGVDGRWSRSIR